MVINYNQLNGYILPNLGDRLEMSHHLEGRTPFFDDELASFVSTFPPEYLLHIPTLNEKMVLKEAFRAMLPDSTYEAHKHPFFPPVWLDVSQTPTGRFLFTSSWRYLASN